MPDNIGRAFDNGEFPELFFKAPGRQQKAIEKQKKIGSA